MTKLTKLNRKTWPKYAKEKLGVFPNKVWDLSYLWIYYSYRRKKVFEFIKKEANRTGFTLEYVLNTSKSIQLDEFKESYKLPRIEKAKRLYNTNAENYSYLDKPVRVLIYDEINSNDDMNNVRHICMVPTECIIPIDNNDLLWENVVDDFTIELVEGWVPTQVEMTHELLF